MARGEEGDSFSRSESRRESSRERAGDAVTSASLSPSSPSPPTSPRSLSPAAATAPPVAPPPTAASSAPPAPPLLSPSPPLAPADAVAAAAAVVDDVAAPPPPPLEVVDAMPSSAGGLRAAKGRERRTTCSLGWGKVGFRLGSGLGSGLGLLRDDDLLADGDEELPVDGDVELLQEEREVAEVVQRRVCSGTTGQHRRVSERHIIMLSGCVDLICSSEGRGSKAAAYSGAA